MSVSIASPCPPSIESLLSHAAGVHLIERFGREPAVSALRAEVAERREQLKGGRRAAVDADALIEGARERLIAERAPSLRPVINLTGTVIHTNLGRAPLPEEALKAVAAVARGASNLEFDLRHGRRGDRDAHVENWLVRLTGAEAATVVNNNAAAVFLVLDTIARRREVVVSRGELVEIGGSFRVPDIMARAGAKLREVGTTNRTRLDDYAAAVGPRTAALMRVHASNYRIEGFTESAEDRALGALAARVGLPFVVDLGAGSLVDLSRFGLPREPTPRDAIEAGAALVTFSGDKLLGGPQAGLIVGRRDLIARLNRNPLKRALRCDKMTIAALAAVLPVYAAPDLLPERLPALRLLTRSDEAIAQQAERLREPVASALAGLARVEVAPCRSQVGSGALPVDLLPSAALRLLPQHGRLSAKRLCAALRSLPVPVVGRIEAGAVLLDLRCLEDDGALTDQLPALVRLLAEGGP